MYARPIVYKGPWPGKWSDLISRFADLHDLTIETANTAISEIQAAQEPELAPGDYVTIAITDTGSGIAPELQGRTPPRKSVRAPGLGCPWSLALPSNWAAT